MLPTLQQLYVDLNQETLRVRRPAKFIFFCGGAMGLTPSTACSLRHFLLNERKVGARIHANIVLAEKATKLYRDTTYNDLITFEEDIARISAMVLLVAESAGSLAELGAFAAIDSIRKNLTVLIQTEHETEESFVRHGPIEKIKKEDERRIGVFPWRLRHDRTLIKASAKPHVSSIVRLINDLLSKIPKDEAFRVSVDYQPFAIILWVLHLSHAISIQDLHAAVLPLIRITVNELKNKLYCMELANWVSKYSYGHHTYWFSLSSDDPISRYSFVPGVVHDVGRRKSEVFAEIQGELKLQRHVREHVLSQKRSVP